MAPNPRRAHIASSMPRRLCSEVFQCGMQGTSHRHPREGSQLRCRLMVDIATLGLELPGEQPLIVVSGQRRKPFIHFSIILNPLALALAPWMRQFDRSPSGILPFCTSSFNLKLPNIYNSSIAAKRCNTTSILLALYPHVLLYFAFTRRISWVWPRSFNPTG